MPASARALSINLPARSESGSTANEPRCSSSRARQTRPIVLPSWSVARSRADRPPRTRPRWRPCARVRASTIVEASPCRRTPMISPSSRHSIGRAASAYEARRCAGGGTRASFKAMRSASADIAPMNAASPRHAPRVKTPPADRARQARARVIKEEVKRACLRLPCIGPQAHPARSDRVAAEEPDRDNANPDDCEPQAVRQGEDDADRHECDGEANDAAPAMAPGKFAHPCRGDRADEIDAVHQADRRRVQREGRGLQSEADVIVCGDEGAHEQEADCKQISETLVAEMQPNGQQKRDRLYFPCGPSLSWQREGEGG